MTPYALTLTLWLLCHPAPAVSPDDLVAALLGGLVWPDWEPTVPSCAWCCG